MNYSGPGLIKPRDYSVAILLRGTVFLFFPPTGAPVSRRLPDVGTDLNMRMNSQLCHVVLLLGKLAAVPQDCDCLSMFPSSSGGGKRGRTNPVLTMMAF